MIKDMQCWQIWLQNLSKHFKLPRQKLLLLPLFLYFFKIPIDKRKKDAIIKPIKHIGFMLYKF